MPFRLKTILGIASIEAALLLILILSSINFLRTSNEQELLNRAYTLARIFATTTQDAVLSTDLALLESATQQALANPGVVYVRIRGPQDLVFAEGGDATQLKRPFQANNQSHTIDDGVFDANADIIIAGTRYGRVEIGLSTATLQEVLTVARHRMAIIAIIGMVVVALFSFMLGHYLTRGLDQLRDASRRLASGELGFTIPVKGRDELAETAVTFNEMSQRLSDLHKQRTKAEADIHALNALLETRVQQRTAELEATNQELEAFSYSVSHDLRAPLRAIDGFAQALAEDYTDKLDAPGLGYLARVRASAQRMGEMIDDMLALARVTRAELSVREVDMSALAREIGARLAAAHPGRVVDFAVTENLITQADVGLLRIALENLLENAWKYSSTRAAARIQFGVKQDTTETVYFVRDDGVGFDMRYADKLFQPFQRLHKTTDFAGTGIGLATVARIIHRHGGRVWAEATVDQGAVFYFTLGAR